MIDTAEQLAAEYKVSPRTIKGDGQFAQAVDTLLPLVVAVGEVVLLGYGYSY